MLVLVGIHHVALDGDVARHDGLHGRHVGHEEVERERGALEHGEQLRVGDHAVLDDLAAAVGELGGLERGQTAHVCEHRAGLPEGPRQVLAGLEVDGGLAAHGGVHHGEQARRHLDVRDSAQVARRGKAREVAHHAAAEGHHRVAAGELALGQELQAVHERGGALSLLARLEGEGMGLEPGLREGGADHLGVEGADVRVGHDRGARGAGTRLAHGLAHALE